MRKFAWSGLCALACAGTAFGQWSDDFDRPDGPIGGDWSGLFGNFGNFIVESNRGGKTAVSSAEAIVHNTASTNYADVEHVMDVHVNGTGLQYNALMIGLGGSANLFIKIQQQGGVGFGNIGFYSGNNGTGGWPGAAPTFITADAPFSDARMRVYFTNAGDTLNLEFDTDFNGTPDQTYQRSGVAAYSAGFGQQSGIGIFGPGRIDNWRVGPETPPCYPDCDTSTGVGVLDIFDFLCFQNRYDVGSPYACDCDTSTGVGVCDIFDFICFQNAYAAGCP